MDASNIINLVAVALTVAGATVTTIKVRQQHTLQNRLVEIAEHHVEQLKAGTVLAARLKVAHMTDDIDGIRQILLEAAMDDS